MPKPRSSWFLRLRDAVFSLLDETVFFRSDGREATRTRHFIHFWILVATSFVRNRGPLRATALAYTTMLALVPLLAVGLGVATSLLKGGGGEEAIKEFVAKIVDETAPQLGLMPRDTSGPVGVAAEDIRDLPGFVTALREETNQVSRFVWEQFAESKRERLLAFEQEIVEKKELKAVLADELNRVIHAGPLYDEARFTNVVLSPGTQTLIQTQPEGDQLVHLNRTLLEQAFPGHLARSAGADARLMVKERIQSFIANVHSGALGITGAIGLILVAVGLLSNIEATFNDIWGVKRGRNWLTRAEHYTAVLFWGPILLVFATGLSISGQVQKTQHLIQRALPSPIGDWVIVGMVFLAPFLLSWIVFSLLYRMIPNTRVEWSAAFVGGLVTCGLWHLNNSLNVMVASRVLTASKIYGPLSALPVFLVGLYFSWLILLCGAQVAYTFQFRRAYLQDRQTETVNQRGREFVALRMAAVIGEHFQEGKPAPTAAEIAETLGVPVRLVHQVGDALLAAGLMTRVAAEEVAYLPGRPLERITVHDVLLAMRAGQGQELATLESPARSLVRGEYERIEQAERRVASAVSLLDVVNRLPRPVEVLTAGAEEPIPPAPPPVATKAEPAVASPLASNPEAASAAAESSSDAPPLAAERATRLPPSEVPVESSAPGSEPLAVPPITTDNSTPPANGEAARSGQPAASVGGQSFPL